MEKEKGFTLLEVMLAATLIVILAGIIYPYFRSVVETHRRMVQMNRVDSSLSKGIEIIKRAARGAKESSLLSSGAAIEVTSGGSMVIINIPKEGSGDEYVEEYVRFNLRDGALYVESEEDSLSFSSSAERVLVPNVVVTDGGSQVSKFAYNSDNGILTMYFKISVANPGEAETSSNTRELRDAAVTRINFDM
jgi:prepilin-type N-terminal cleavage/methylation domain-containing protein